MIDNIKEIYHALIRKEWEIYEYQKTLNKVFLSEQDLLDLKISKNVINELLEEGLLIKLSENKYRTLLMDLAFRASDIRIKHNGTKYVLECSLKLLSRPVLDYSYMSFERESNELLRFKNLLFNELKDEKLVNAFIASLKDAGIKGLSKYQYDSIFDFIKETKDVVISAPTAFGKTYCFMIPVLIEALKRSIEKKTSTLAIIFYPRKSLGSDQMGKLIRLIYYINNRCQTRITIGIDDGDTKREQELSDGEIYRGIKCPLHPDTTLTIKNKKVYCRSCNKYFDFICVSREDFEKNPPMIILTNVWAYQYRLVESKYWSNGYLGENIKFFIFDEIHAYRSLVAGIIRYLIKINKKLVSPNSRLIISSATIPKLEEFVYEITGNKTKDMLCFIYDEKRHGKDDEKLELYLLVGINPYTSWETYTHELVIFLSTVNRLRSKKNLQSLIFVDSIRGIYRLFDQLREAIKLGDPKDHLDFSLSPEDPFCYWVYNEDFKLDLSEPTSTDKLEKLRNEILTRIRYHHSQYPDRFEVEESIRKGTVDAVFTTSTLELGVDYDNVSVIVNAGIPYAAESIVQRVGRAGRNKAVTLNTALSIIIIRNNPLEYFFIYKGIDSLLDLNNMPKIPVSYTNQFVIFYSILLYILALFVKNNKIIKENNIKKLDSLLNYFNDNKEMIIKELEIPTEISKIKDDVEKIIKVLINENMQELCEKIFSYTNLTYLISQLENSIKVLDDIIYRTEEKIILTPKREQEHYIKNLNKLKEYSNLLKKVNSIKEKTDLNYVRSVVFGIIDCLYNINKLLTNKNSPLYPLRDEFVALAYNFEGYRKEIDNLIDKINLLPVKLNSKEYMIYSKACEIYRSSPSNIIQMIENIIGFRFMGNEFIDHKVNLKFEFSKEIYEEFLTNLMSRIPPFELTNIPFESKEQRSITEIVGARHFWLPKASGKIVFLGEGSFRKHNRRDSISDLISYLNEHYLLKGSVTKLKDIVIPDTIEFIDILSYPFPLILKITTTQGPLYIKYGSKFITTSKIHGKYDLYENIGWIYSIDIHEEKYRIIHEATRSHLIGIEKSIKNKNPWGVNFRYVAYCNIGKCISTDPYDVRCPKEVQNDCRECNGEEFWSKIRKPFPKVYTVPNVRNIPHMSEPLIMSLDTKTYEEINEDIEFVYDRAFLYLPQRFGNYSLREVEFIPIGYLAKTSLISLRFNTNLLKIFTEKVLKEDNELRELLKLKYYLYNQYYYLRSSSDTSISLLDYDPRKEIDPNKFIQFVQKSLIHSLTHLFYIFLSREKLNIDPERMIYVIEDGNMYILENSKNDGIGIVETILREIQYRGKNALLNEFYRWCNSFLNEHDKHISYSEKEIKNESKKIVEKLKSNIEIGKDIQSILENLDRLNATISSKVPLKLVDLITYRYIISQKLNIREELSEYLLNIINSQDEIHLCYDGCNECIILQNECREPFAQIYLLSKQLILKFLKFIMTGSTSLFKKGVGSIIEEFMKQSDEIKIKTPFIDEFGVNLLYTLSKEGKKISITVKEISPAQFENLKKAGVKVKLSEEKTHAKVYYLKSEDTEICIHGSANLTRNGFYENEENLTIIWDTNQVKAIVKDIE